MRKVLSIGIFALGLFALISGCKKKDEDASGNAAGYINNNGSYKMSGSVSGTAILGDCIAYMQGSTLVIKGGNLLGGGQYASPFVVLTIPNFGNYSASFLVDTTTNRGVVNTSPYTALVGQEGTIYIASISEKSVAGTFSFGPYMSDAWLAAGTFNAQIK